MIFIERKKNLKTYKTGGGQSQIHSSTISNKIIGMMGNRFDSVESPYDSDGDFASTSAIINKSYTPGSTDDQFTEIFDESSPVECKYFLWFLKFNLRIFYCWFFLDSYLGPNDSNLAMEGTSLPKSPKLYEVVDDQQHSSYGKHCYSNF